MILDKHIIIDKTLQDAASIFLVSVNENPQIMVAVVISLNIDTRYRILVRI